MRLLVTRAAEDAARTRARLEASGHRVIVSPVLEIVATAARWPIGVVDVVLATSGQAFSVMDGWSDPSPETRRVVPLWIVGDRTAELARAHGFEGPIMIAPNVAMLAIAVSKLQTFPKRCLYLAGHDRKPDIETAFNVIGHRLDVLEVYEARETLGLAPEASEALAQGHVRGVLHFSRRSAALFVKQADAAGVDVRPLHHFCLSEDVADFLRGTGCDKIDVAEAPNEATLLAVVDDRQLALR